jgi:small subunit ribosomal protein S1
LKPDDVVSEGETVSVMIKDIDLEKRRISLSLKDAEGDPWLDVAEKYPVGQPAEGIVENKESFGFFIRLEPGITGLLPKSKIADSYDASTIEKLKEGDPLTVIVEELNSGERKITLGPGDSADVKNWKAFGKENKSSSLGALGEKLQEAMKRKEKE